MSLIFLLKIKIDGHKDGVNFPE